MANGSQRGVRHQSLLGYEPVVSLPLYSDLGPLEEEIIHAVWTGGPGNIREIAYRIDRKLATQP